MVSGPVVLVVFGLAIAIIWALAAWMETGIIRWAW